MDKQPKKCSGDNCNCNIEDDNDINPGDFIAILKFINRIKKNQGICQNCKCELQSPHKKQILHD